jgi:hypothetical protein
MNGSVRQRTLAFVFFASMVLGPTSRLQRTTGYLLKYCTQWILWVISRSFARWMTPYSFPKRQAL